MNKAVYIIVSNYLCNDIVDILLKNNLKCTKIHTTGAYLNNGETTLLIITENDKVDAICTLVQTAKRKLIDNNEQQGVCNVPEKFLSVHMFSTPIENYMRI